MGDGDSRDRTDQRAGVDADIGELISDAEVAEIPFTAFTSHRKDEQVTCRLVVRRVKRLNAKRKAGQDTLFETQWSASN